MFSHLLNPTANSTCIRMRSFLLRLLRLLLYHDESFLIFFLMCRGNSGLNLRSQSVNRNIHRGTRLLLNENLGTSLRMEPDGSLDGNVLGLTVCVYYDLLSFNLLKLMVTKQIRGCPSVPRRNSLCLDWNQRVLRNVRWLYAKHLLWNIGELGRRLLEGLSYSHRLSLNIILSEHFLVSHLR